MDIQDDSDTLRDYFAHANPEDDMVESVHRAEVDASHALVFMANPKEALKAIGVPVTDASRVDITMKNRASRDAVALSSATERKAQQALRRIIIVVIHYRNCDSDIIIFAMR